MMKITLAEGKKLPSLQMVTLGVYANNPRAIHLYKKLGFKNYGTVPKAIHHKGKYVDEILMYKNL